MIEQPEMAEPRDDWRNPHPEENSPASIDLSAVDLDSPASATADSGRRSVEAALTEESVSSRQQESRRYGKPYLEIEEQPKERGFRFRYQCEGPSHGGLPGASSDTATRKRTHPTVRLHNPDGIRGGKCRVVVSLICCDDPLRPHAHSLVGRNVYSGQCVVEIGKDTAWRASFPNLGILHVTKKNVARVLVERYALALVGGEEMETEQEPSADEELAGGKEALEKLPKSDVIKITELAEEQARTMKLNAVRLCFQAFLQDNDGQYSVPLPPCISNVIHDSKAPSAAALKICRLDRHSGRVEGGEEVYLLCDRVQKDDIAVKFYEVNKDGNTVWEADGVFSPSDVHRQFAIVFKTPAYRFQTIRNPVSCWLRLQRKSDDEFSEPKPFCYQPKVVDEELIGRKRKKTLVSFQNYYGGMFGGPPNPPSGGGAGGGTGGANRPPGGFGDGLGLGDGFGGLGGWDLDFTGSGGGGGNNLLGAYGVTAGDKQSTSKAQAQSHQQPLSARSGAQQGPGETGAHNAVLKEVEMALSAQLEQQLQTEEQVKVQTQQQQQQLLGHQQRQLEQQRQQKQRLQQQQLKQQPLQHQPLQQQQQQPLQQQQQPLQQQQQQQQQQQPGSPHQSDKPASGQDADASPQAQVLARKKQLFEAQLAHLSSAFQTYARTGDTRCLLATQRRFTSEKNENGDTALHLAIIRQQPQVLAQMVDVLDGLPQNVINFSNQLRQSPLHLAIITKQVQLSARLVRAGANVMQVDRFGNNSAHLACKDGSADILKVVLDHGSGQWLEALNFDGMTPAHLAVVSDSSNCLQLLYDAHANMNAPDGKSGRTPLHHAIEKQHLTVAGWLLTTVGVDITTQAYDGSTPLHWAAGRGLDSMVKLLVAAGADVSVANNTGDTPMSLAPTPEIRALLVPQEMDTSTSAGRPAGDLIRLTYMVRQQLAYLLDRDHSWSTLSDLLGFGNLSTAFSLCQSPTQELLVHYELGEGTIADLKAALATMQRNDAIDLLTRALSAPVPGLGHGGPGGGNFFASALDSSLIHEAHGRAGHAPVKSPVPAN